MDLILSTMKQRYKQYKYSAKQRGLEFKISIIDFAQATLTHCYICNKSGKDYILGIDRLTNKWGYYPYNIAGCCKRCNVAKNDMTFIEFKEWMKGINPNHYLCQDTKVELVNNLDQKKVSFKSFLEKSKCT